ncbi:hypothetical protein LUZ63_018772 [Rhynchospora breviuscula]|uniref:SHSP domain-containing protein n=1 Tax=Rhynchospora breviuscula TaxID=2022672 RepID=A0A9Q0C517_9POAL|nr:hypothetical protein LUZ63_018772 [Rhynchospora breviuscula]
MDAILGSVAGQRIYEDFVPSHDLAEGETADTLMIDVTGFKKEQIKVMIDNYGKLRITGERPLGDNKWTRFRKDFQIPEDCNTAAIRAKFENSRVIITLPKLVVDPVPPQDQTTQTATQDKPAVTEPKLPSANQNGQHDKVNGEQREEKRSDPALVDAQKKVEDKEANQNNKDAKGTSNAVSEPELTKKPQSEISAPVEPKLSTRFQTFKQNMLETAYDSRKAICSAFAILVFSVGVGLIVYNLNNDTDENAGALQLVENYMY